jgi:pimeloyl-ACP methyl ester carboxylesterase
MDVLEGRIPAKTQTIAGFTTDIYTKIQSQLPLLIVHGVNPTGKDSPDLIRISEALAQVGFEVIVPDFPDMRKQHVGPEQATAVAKVFQGLGHDAGIACFSYGCGPALIAAAGDIRMRVRFIVTFGGYFDMRDMLEYIVVDQAGKLGYSKWEYLAANPHLSKAGPIDHLFNSTTAAEFRQRLNEAPQQLRTTLDELSPSRYVENLHAPLIIVHGAYDPSVPPSQAEKLARAAARFQIPYGLTLLDIHGHTAMEYPSITLSNVLTQYIPEGLKLLATVHRILSYR